MTDPFMRYTGVSFEALITAFFGGAASMLFVQGGFLPRLMSLVIGVISAVFLSPFLFSVAKFFSPGAGDGLERAVVFLSGFLGMVMLAGVYGVAARVRDRAAKLADKAIDRIG
jgi:Na+/H+ antiporter NhaC